MNKDDKNSLIFSVNYENYITRVKEDKPNKTLGTWDVSPEYVEKLKYAYIYLKNSQQMIVKKLEIDYFELSDPRKGYDDDDLQCVVFKKSEDVFFEYPYSVVQGRHYRNDEDMDSQPRLDQDEINRRMALSKSDSSSSEANRKEKRGKTGIVQPAQVRLRKLFAREYTHRQMPHFEIVKKMIEKVDNDPEQDLNALLDEHYLVEDNKKKQ